GAWVARRTGGCHLGGTRVAEYTRRDNPRVASGTASRGATPLGHEDTAGLFARVRTHPTLRGNPRQASGVRPGAEMREEGRRRRTARGLSSGATAMSYLVLVAWSAVVLFPLYWIATTSLKLPVQVYSGPAYLPFIDYQPSLHAWRYIFVDLRNDTLRPFVNTVVVAVTSSILALVLGSAAGYGLLRFRYRPRLGVVLSFVGSALLAGVAIGLAVPWSIAVTAGAAAVLL